MSHWVFKADQGGYVGTRKATNPRDRYEARTSLAADLGEARVFNTKAAASLAGKLAKIPGAGLEVSVSLKCL